MIVNIESLVTHPCWPQRPSASHPWPPVPAPRCVLVSRPVRR